MGADRLDPGPGDQQMDDVVVGPERDRDPGPVRSQPELLARHGQVPRRGHHPVELDRSRDQRRHPQHRLGCRSVLGGRGRGWGGGQGRRKPEGQRVALEGRDRGEPVGR